MHTLSYKNTTKKSKPFFSLSKNITGESHQSKIKKIISFLRLNKADYLFVSAPENVAWLLNIRGFDNPTSPIPNSRLIIGKNGKLLLIAKKNNIQKIYKEKKIKKKQIIDFYNFEETINQLKGTNFIIDNQSCSIFAEKIIRSRFRILNQKDPIYTLKTCFIGTLNILNLAVSKNATLLFTSTSEIYGEPLISPQNEEYRGNVNTLGIRSCYDEGKRVAETLVMDFHRKYILDIRIARIFNTYGPKMDKNDGRVVSNFINQALTNRDITIYGDGSQTRSFCYVDDMVTGLIKLMQNNETIGPINLGNPFEISIKDLAVLIQNHTASSSKLIFKELPQDDPLKRNPDITKAKNILNWEPSILLDDGLQKTIYYFIYLLKKNRIE